MATVVPVIAPETGPDTSTKPVQQTSILPSTAAVQQTTADGSSKRMVTGMFHEKQYLMHCAVHTLNNLFQESWATAPLMEDIAKEL